MASPVPGLLYVTMQPHAELPDSVFHDWYNNEHGPTRLRLPFVANGYRYRAADLGDAGQGSKEKPEWVALYDIPDMNALNSEAYLSLRGPPLKSEREAATMKKIHVDRRVYDLVSDKKKAGYKELDDVDADAEAGGVLVSVTAILKPGADEAEYKRWAEEEHVELLSKVPGWRRSRRFKYSSVVKPLGPADEVKHTEYVALHEYDRENGLGTSPEFKAATTTPWTTKVNAEIVGEKKRRVYNLAYTFGPAPRYLSSLAAGDVPEFKHPDGITKTVPASNGAPAAIESFVTTPDGVNLEYRLDGGASSSDRSPLIVLVNSILTDYRIWDAFVAAFLADPANAHYRVLRYNSRGRNSACGETPVTVDLLASDAVALLDALRVPRAASVVGVSLGGVTALAAALNHPSRVASFVACDTNPVAPAANPKLWADRIAVADAEGATAAAYGGGAASLSTVTSDDEPLVGERLAEATVRRWFVPGSYEDASLKPTLDAVKAGVERNSLRGFKTAVRALYSYDYAEAMRTGAVPGAFLVGAGDGKLPEGMKKMAEGYADGKGPYYLVQDAGHLPMVEKPEVVKGHVTEFLRANGL